jgi:hypothetical protein
MQCCSLPAGFFHGRKGIGQNALFHFLSTSRTKMPKSFLPRKSFNTEVNASESDGKIENNT